MSKHSTPQNQGFAPLAQLRKTTGYTHPQLAYDIGTSPRLERRMHQIEALSPKPKQQLLGLIDTFITAEQHRLGAKP